MPGAVLLLSFTLATAGPTVETRLQRAQAAYDNLDYELAAQELAVALADPRITGDQRMRANLLAGVSNRIIGRDVEARMNFSYVLKRNPAARLPPSTPPKILSFFDLVRADLEGGDTVALQRGGGEMRDDLSARPLTGRAALTIETTPPGAAVFVDKRRLGTSPLTANDVTPGTSQVAVRRSNGQVVAFEVPLYDAEQTVVNVAYENGPPEDGELIAHYGWVSGKLGGCLVLSAFGTGCVALGLPSLTNFNSTNLTSYGTNVVCSQLLCTGPGIVCIGLGLGLGGWGALDLLNPPEGDGLGHVAVQSPREDAPTRFTITEREDAAMAH